MVSVGSFVEEKSNIPADAIIFGMGRYLWGSLQGAGKEGKLFIVEFCCFLQDALSVGLGYACISVQNL